MLTSLGKEESIILETSENDIFFVIPSKVGAMEVLSKELKDRGISLEKSNFVRRHDSMGATFFNIKAIKRSEESKISEKSKNRN